MTHLSTTEFHRWLRYVVAGTVILTLSLMAVWSLSLGYSDMEFRIGTRDAVRRAVWASPGDAGYMGQDSLVENAAEARRHLEKAVALNPYYSWAWIQLGLAAESSGNIADAQRFLSQASRVDHLFATRWVMCDFYYRQAQFGLFWEWVHQALEIDESDSRPIFRLAARVLPDPAALLKQIAPSNSRTAGNLASFLTEEQPPETAASAITELISTASIEESQILISYSDKLLEAGHGDAAMKVWNALCLRGFLPFATLDPRQGSSLTNNEFASAPSGHGFDWHLKTVEGVTPELERGRIKLTFSGNQPDHCQILFQKIPVVADGAYELHFRNQFDSTRPGKGLKWKVYRSKVDDPGALVAESIDLTNADMRQQDFAFRSPHETLITLLLEYERPRGETRLSGVATLERLSLSLGQGQ
jgi:hypothetical protein